MHEKCLQHAHTVYSVSQRGKRICLVISIHIYPSPPNSWVCDKNEITYDKHLLLHLYTLSALWWPEIWVGRLPLEEIYAIIGLRDMPTSMKPGGHVTVLSQSGLLWISIFSLWMRKLV